MPLDTVQTTAMSPYEPVPLEKDGTACKKQRRHITEDIADFIGNHPDGEAKAISVTDHILDQDALADDAAASAPGGAPTLRQPLCPGRPLHQHRTWVRPLPSAVCDAGLTNATVSPSKGHPQRRQPTAQPSATSKTAASTSTSSSSPCTSAPTSSSSSSVPGMTGNCLRAQLRDEVDLSAVASCSTASGALGAWQLEPPSVRRSPSCSPRLRSVCFVGPAVLPDSDASAASSSIAACDRLQAPPSAEGRAPESALQSAAAPGLSDVAAAVGLTPPAVTWPGSFSARSGQQVNAISKPMAADVANTDLDTVAHLVHAHGHDLQPLLPGLSDVSTPQQPRQALPVNADPQWTFQRDGFLLQPRGRPFVLEVFAGSGRLTKHLRGAGLDAWAVDWKGGRLQTETPSIVMLNLTAKADRHALFRLLEHPELLYVHFAPPCGTASRARDIPLGEGADRGPPPLRSEAFPEGLPDLTPKQRARVSAANLLYNLTATCAEMLLQKNILWSIENPRGSYMWLLPCMSDLCAASDCHMTTFQSCAWGGQRPKWTAWLHFPGLAFAELAAVCPGISSTHFHKPWGRDARGNFATALETVYPEGLCENITALLLKFVGRQPERPLTVLRSRGAQLLRRHRPHRAAAARQARGGAARQLLPEFEKVVCIRGHFPPSDPRCRPGHVWPECDVNGIHVASSSKTVRVSFGGVAGTSSDASSLVEACLPSRGCIKDIAVLGDCDVYIGREFCNAEGRHLSASKWANPFKVQAGRSTEEAIAQFDTMLRSTPALINSLPELLGKRLCCHCRLGRP